MKNRKLLMIQGPIEFEPNVLQALATSTDVMFISILLRLSATIGTIESCLISNNYKFEIGNGIKMTLPIINS